MKIWKYVAQEDGMKSYLNAISEAHAPAFESIVENYGYGYQQPQFSYVQPTQSYRMPRMPKEEDDGILHSVKKWGGRALAAGALVGVGALAHKQVGDAAATAKTVGAGLIKKAEIRALKTVHKKHADLPDSYKNRITPEEYGESAPVRISNLIEQGMSISDFLDSVQENYYPNINHHSSQSALHPDLMASMPGDEDAPEDAEDEVQDDADDEEADLFPKSFGRYALMQMRAKKSAQQEPEEMEDEEEEDPAEDDQDEDDMEESAGQAASVIAQLQSALQTRQSLQSVLESAKSVAIEEAKPAPVSASVITEAIPAAIDPTMLQLVASVRQGNSTYTTGGSDGLHPVLTLNEACTSEIKAKPAGMKFVDDANLDQTLRTLQNKFNSGRID